jgi:hypothetical protein
MANLKKKLVQKIVNWPFEPGSERWVCKIYENTPNTRRHIGLATIFNRQTSEIS